MAINKEIESQALYLGLSQSMNNQTVKEAFVELAQQEQGHRVLLERYSKGDLKQRVLDPEDVVDFRIAEYVVQPLISSDMELEDVFLLAANHEKASYEFYRNLAQLHPASEVNQLLEKLAADELLHKQRVERIYTDVGFPQTDGG